MLIGYGQLVIKIDLKNTILFLILKISGIFFLLTCKINKSSHSDVTDTFGNELHSYET